MTVSELKSLLNGLEDDAQVDLSSDEEGNSYGEAERISQSTLRETGEKVYILFPGRQQMADERYNL